MVALGFTFWRENGEQLLPVSLDNVIEAVCMRPPERDYEWPEVMPCL
jgi:hypothetical protein